jgi:hypothetical protein
MVLFNTDRTKFNVLAKESRSDGETDMIPIDHAQTLQRDRESTSPEELTLPCWAGRSEANNSLTDASKQAIEKLDVDTIVSAAEARGLVLTEVDRAYIGTNIVSMQSSLAENPEITLKEMADFYFGVDLVTSTKNPFDL